jgi:hypothetical protein
MIDRIIFDTDDWKIGTIISKDGTTDYKIISKRKIKNRSMFKYELELQGR